MINAVRSNNPNFKTVTFEEGYNVILADRTETDITSKKSRNGAGKTTLVEIIHFCLGAQVRKESIFKNEHLKGWSFAIDLTIADETFSIERYTDKPAKIYISGNRDKLGIEFKYDKKEHKYYCSVTNFNKAMLETMYGFCVEDVPFSFRELISYSVRKGMDGYRSAFEYYPKQKPASIQGCNAYFLDLNLEYAKEFQQLKEKKAGIDNYKKAIKAGVTGTTYSTIGELNSELITRQTRVDALKKELDSFRVHPRYEEFSDEANQLTERIHELTNQLVIKESLLDRYLKTSVEEEPAIPIQAISMIYEEAGIIFGEKLTHSIEEVLGFHKALIANRKSYLSAELADIQETIKNLKQTIEALCDKRAKLLAILEEHGALQEYTLLQERYSVEYQNLEDVKKRLEVAEYVEFSKSNLEIENQELLKKSRKDYSERIAYREKAVSLFRSNSASLYSEPGTLTIDLDATGYKFDVEIKSSRSQGVNYMKILCYDLVLMDLGLDRSVYPDFLIHDSTIFDGVDERQIARALKLSMEKSKNKRFQYICLINSDMVPYQEFDEQFRSEFDSSIRLRISDEQDNGGLLGIRF